jgi:hypothetical protein
VGDGEKGLSFVDLYKASILRRGGFFIMRVAEEYGCFSLIARSASAGARICKSRKSWDRYLLSRKGYLAVQYHP